MTRVKNGSPDMILMAFDGKFNENKDEIPPRACRHPNELNKNNVEQVDPQKVENNNVDKVGPQKLKKNNVEQVGSYMLIYLHIPSYTFLYLHVPPNSFIYFHIPHIHQNIEY